MTAAQPTMRIV